MSGAVKVQKHRAKRRDEGWIRIDLRLSPERQADLKTIQQDTGLSAQAAISAAIWASAENVRRK